MSQNSDITAQNVFRILAGAGYCRVIDAINRYEINGETDLLANAIKNDSEADIQNILRSDAIKKLLIELLHNHKPRKPRGRPKADIQHKSIVLSIYKLHLEQGIPIQYEDAIGYEDAITKVARAADKKYDTVKKIWHKRDKKHFKEEENALKGH